MALFFSWALMLNVANSATWQLFPVTSSIAPLAPVVMMAGVAHGGTIEGAVDVQPAPAPAPAP
jgi:hypothetical protein